VSQAWRKRPRASDGPSTGGGGSIEGERGRERASARARASGNNRCRQANILKILLRQRLYSCTLTKRRNERGRRCQSRVPDAHRGTHTGWNPENVTGASSRLLPDEFIDDILAGSCETGNGNAPGRLECRAMSLFLSLSLSLPLFLPPAMERC